MLCVIASRALPCKRCTCNFINAFSRRLSDEQKKGATRQENAEDIYNRLSAPTKPVQETTVEPVPHKPGETNAETAPGASAWRRFVVATTNIFFAQDQLKSSNKFGPGYKGTRERFSLLAYVVYTLIFVVIMHTMANRFLKERNERRERFFMGDYKEEFDMGKASKSL